MGVDRYDKERTDQEIEGIRRERFRDRRNGFKYRRDWGGESRDEKTEMVGGKENTKPHTCHTGRGVRKGEFGRTTRRRGRLCVCVSLCEGSKKGNGRCSLGVPSRVIVYSERYTENRLCQSGVISVEGINT